MSAIKSIFGRGRSNVVKILCLAFGLTAALVLIAKVHFEQSFDLSFTDSDRVYSVTTCIVRPNEDNTPFPQVSGGVAPAMEAAIAQIETSTREVPYYWFQDFKDAAGNTYTFSMSLADPNFLDVFDVGIISGNPKQILSNPNEIMVSRKVAEKLGGVQEAIGKTIWPENDSQTKFTVRGVYEDFPENTTVSAEAFGCISLMGEWSLNNWSGNDRYRAYLKLRPGATPAEVDPLMRQELYRHVPKEVMEKYGFDQWYELVPLRDRHNADPSVRNLCKMLTFLAALLLLITTLNYILIVISTLINRTREIAVRKCYGSSAWGIARIVASESLTNLFVALAIGIGLLLILRKPVEAMLSVSYKALFCPEVMWILLLVVLAVFLLIVVVPSWFFIRVPVAAAFRSVRQSRRRWKSCLLFAEFAATAFSVIVIADLSRQYDYMINEPRGYELDNRVYSSLYKWTPEQRRAALAALKQIPAVENATLSSDLPYNGASGNYVWLPDKEETSKINVNDLYFVDEDYFDVMGIDVLEGRSFNPNEDKGRTIMVSRSLADWLKEAGEFQGSMVGQAVLTGEHSENSEDIFRIIGIFEDIKPGSIGTFEKPAMVFFDIPASRSYYQPSHIVVKLREGAQDALGEVNRVMASVVPDKPLLAEPVKNIVLSQYEHDKLLRDSVMACGFIVLVIALSGLLGYVTDEVNSRRREIAIRKVNGATVGSVLRMLVKGVTPIALPALVVGALLAWWASSAWLANYKSHVDPSVLVSLLCVIAVYLVIITCVVWRAWRAANANPTEALNEN